MSNETLESALGMPLPDAPTSDHDTARAQEPKPDEHAPAPPPSSRGRGDEPSLTGRARRERSSGSD